MSTDNATPAPDALGERAPDPLRAAEEALTPFANAFDRDLPEDWNKDRITPQHLHAATAALAQIRAARAAADRAASSVDHQQRLGAAWDMLFRPGMKITLVVRTPSHSDGSPDLVMTNDIINEAITALLKRKHDEQRKEAGRSALSNPPKPGET